MVRKDAPLHSTQQGYTLMELMIVIAILGTLIAVALPAYQQYRVRANRTDVQTALVDIARKLETYKLANGDYGANNANSGYATNPLINPVIFGGTTYPRTGTALYNLSITASPAQAWTLTATPIAGRRQANDGIVVLNDQGQRCWDRTATTVACTPSATTSWATR